MTHASDTFLCSVSKAQGILVSEKSIKLALPRGAAHLGALALGARAPAAEPDAAAAPAQEPGQERQAHHHRDEDDHPARHRRHRAIEEQPHA